MADYTVKFKDFVRPSASLDEPELGAAFSTGLHREKIVGDDIYVQCVADDTDVIFTYEPVGGIADGLYLFKGAATWDTKSTAANDGTLGFGFMALDNGDPDTNNSVEGFLVETDNNEVNLQAQKVVNGTANIIQSDGLRRTGVFENTVAIVKDGDDFDFWFGVTDGCWKYLGKQNYNGTSVLEVITVHMRNSVTTRGGNKICKLKSFDFKEQLLLP